MLKRRNLVIGGALALLAGAVSLGHSWLTERDLADQTATVQVVVTRGQIPARRRLEGPLLQLQAVPKAQALPGVFHAVERAAGRLTTVTLLPGEQVVAARTVRADDPAGLAAALAAGERGAVVTVEPGTAKTVRPGDSVDAVAVVPSEDGLSQTSRLISEVRVLKVGPAGDSALGQPWVMLAVTPAQAQTLALAEETGKVRLVLRSGAEGRSRSPSPPSKAAPSPRSGTQPVSSRPTRLVEVIRGVERETQANQGAEERH